MINVLVVDDEEDICDFLRHTLESLGAEVKTALLGEEAVRLIAENKWDMAVVDLKLNSAITGLDVIRALRKKDPDTVVVAMSGYVDVGLRQETEKLGVSDFLEKPGDISPNIFSERVGPLISKLQ